MERFTKIVNDWKLLNTFPKVFISDIWQSPENTSVLNHPNSYFFKLVSVNEFIFLANLQGKACNFTRNDFFLQVVLTDFIKLQARN